MTLQDSWSALRSVLQRKPRSEQSEQLLELYRNRVELKKEFSRLQDENYNLQQQLKRHDHAQVQTLQRLEQLEAFLGKPENGLTALVFYQLRALWQLACKRLQELNQELCSQQQDRERRLQVMDFDQHRQRALAELEQALLDAQSLADSFDARVQLMQRRIQELRWFWHHKKRRELQGELHQLQREQFSAHQELLRLEDDRSALKSAVCSEFPGLSVEGKRLVNTATLAYAQQLLERLGADGLVPLSKEASIRGVLEANYGSTTQCQHWLTKLSDGLALLHNSPRDLQHLKQNTQRLRGNAFYRTDHDTVPVPESIGMVSVNAAESGSDPVVMVAEEINILLDDYWDLYAVLLH